MRRPDDGRPSARIRQRVGYLSEDRKGEGLALPMSVADNLTITGYRSCAASGVVAPVAQRAQTRRWIADLGIKAHDPDQPVRTLSGGNQQKVALGRLLHQDADVLLLDEPTRGVDIGSKAQIYEVIAATAATGQGGSDGQLVSARTVRAVRSARGDEPGPAVAGPPDRGLDAGTRAPAAADADWMSWQIRRRCARRHPTRHSRSWLATLGPFLGLLAVIGVFALLTDTPDQYLSVRNFRIVVAQTVIVALGAIGMTMIIVSGGIDLSVGSVIALTGVVTAIAIRDGVSPLMAVVYSVLAGGVVGVINGLLITRLRVIPFIATLGTLGMARGVAKWIAGQQTVNVPPTWVNELAVTFPQPEWLIVAPGVWLSVALAVLASLVLRYTVFGRRVFAIGSNEAAARACGIAVDRLKIWIYGLAGLLFGLSGVMQMSRLRQGDPTVAIGTELDIIAAVVIGGGSLSGGVGTILGSMIGATIMAVLRNGSQQMGWPNYIQEIIIGAIIVIAVAIDGWRHRRS